MALVHNNLLGVYAGVSKQALDLRLPNNCEEMINIYPTIHSGLRRRNPTTQLSTSIITEPSQFMHTYDRGLAGESEEQYVVTIDSVNNLRVFDINSNSYRTVNYTGNALKYLECANYELGFSAITVKDTTFIANEDIIPIRIGETSTTGGTITKYNKQIIFDANGYSSNFSTIDNATHPVVSSIKTGLAPSVIKTYKGTYTIKVLTDYTTSNVSYTVYSESSIGGIISIVVDGTTYKYQVAIKNGAYNSYAETIGEMRSNIYTMLHSQLNPSLYSVELNSSNSIVVYKLDGTAITLTTSILLPSSVDINPIALQSASSVSYKQSNARGFSTTVKSLVSWVYQTTSSIGASFVSSIVSGSGVVSVSSSSNYDSQAYIWVKSVSPDTTFPYTFSLSIREPNGTVLGTTTTAATTTTAVATALAAWADTLTGFTSVSDGSVVKITRDNATVFEIVLSDTFGDQASSGWIGVVTSMDDLPKHMPFKDVIVKVDGLNRTDDNAYWVKYDGKTWVEHRDPRVLNKIDATTMPHKLTRNKDYTFTLSAIEWDEMKVGDDVTNPKPDFIGNAVKDLFFVNSRLGILTRNGICLSQQGEFTNFFRTTILNLLDDSAITTYIDSNKSVGLEYAAELGDNIILFGDKQQFALDATKGITPSSISVSSQSRYEINRNVRPISHGDAVYFVVKRGDYSSLMKMDAATLATVSRAEDISSHVPTYLDDDIIQIVGSIRNQVIFIKSKSKTDTIYVYNSHMVDREDKQKAWSKWVFSSNISSIFVFDRYLYLFGNRYDTTIPTEEFTFVNTIDYSKVIEFETYISYGDVLSSPSFERIDIDPYGLGANYKDNETVKYNSEVELSEWSLTDKASVKELRGSLLIKTIMVSSVDGSDFSLDIEDKERGTIRTIPALYTVGRKPFISGNSKNMRIKIKSNNGNGFQINSISLEGQYNNRSTRTS